jgi:hypothetical protein
VRTEGGVVRRRVVSGALWGLVGLFAFLVLVQGYRLLVGPLPADLVTLLAVGVVVGTVVGTLSYLLEHRLTRKGRT